MSTANLIEIRDEVWAAGLAARIDQVRQQVVVSFPGIRFCPDEGNQPCVHEVRVTSMAGAHNAIRSAA